jgi:arabinose-5-phosphate isomerase
MTPGSNVLDRQAGDVMTAHPVTAKAGMLAAEALRLLEQRKITSLVIVDEGGVALGVLHLHDLWHTQMI